METLDGRNKKSPQPIIMAKREIDKGTREFKILVSYFYVVENLIRLGDYHGYSANHRMEQNYYEVTLRAKDF